MDRGAWQATVYARNTYPTTYGKDPSSGTMRRKRGSSGCGRDSRASSRGMYLISLLEYLEAAMARWDFKPPHQTSVTLPTYCHSLFVVQL